LLALFFSLQITRKYIRQIIQYSILPFILFCFYDYAYTDKPIYAFLPLAIECLALLLVLIFLFYEKLQNSLEIPIYQTSLFWVIVAFILYFSGNFFLFLYSRNYYNDKNFVFQYDLIYDFVTITKNLLICIGISIKDKEPINNSRLPNIDLIYTNFPNQ
jgi:hypothetical protein